MKFTAAMILAFASVAAASPIDSKSVSCRMSLLRRRQRSAASGSSKSSRRMKDLGLRIRIKQIIKKDEDSESDSIDTANKEKRRIRIKQIIKKYEDSETEAAPTEDAATEDKRRIRIKQIIKKNGDSA
ncbi:hypothetical protein DL95DRAFT_412482 [Leptodontidium sp. 2 PMI_412]|nr:hypothetical protein DL95DRAFT_412482 [Leptodontidium sp. 2 PMI_412]